MYHKQISVVEVAGLEMKICVTIREVNQAAVVLAALQEATATFVLVADLVVVVALETQTNIEMVEMEWEIKVATIATSVMSITLFSI